MYRRALRSAREHMGAGFVVVILVVGVMAALFGGTHVLEHNGAVQENQPVDGVVESTDVDRRVIENDDGPDDYEYRPVVTYSYTVDGQEYTQDNVFPGSFGRWRDSRRWAARIAGEYEAGGEVTARYNPRKPSDAYIRNDGWPGEWLVTAGYGGLLVAGGAGLIVRGFIRRKQRTLMEDTPTEQAESLSMGPSEISGVARTNDREPTSAPFTDEECVVATWEVLEYDEDSDDDGGSWQLVDSGLEGVPFYVDDGTGSVLVRPHVDAVYELDESEETTIRVDADETPPDAIQAFFGRASGVGPVTRSSSGSGPSEGDRKYRQNLIQPGEDVYVFGTVQPREDATGTSNVENLHIRKVTGESGPEEPMFLIADEPESELIAERRWALWRVPVGVLFAAGGVGVLVAVFGPPIGITLPVVPV